MKSGTDRLSMLNRALMEKRVEEILADMRNNSKDEGGDYHLHVPEAYEVSLEKALGIFRAERGYEFAQPPRPLVEAQVLARQQMDEEERVPLRQVLEGLGRPGDAAEALHVWKVLASVSTTSDFWDDDRVGKLVSLVNDLVPDMDWPQLQTMVWGASLALRYHNPQPLPLKKLWNSLDHECTQRLTAEVRRERRVARERRTELLHMAYLHIKVRHGTNFLLNKWSTRYLRRLVALFLGQEMHLSSVTAKEFVFLMFLLGWQREFPISKFASSRKTNPGRKEDATSHNEMSELPEYVANRICRVLPELDVGEVGIICHSIHKVRMRLHKNSQELNTKLVAVLRDAPSEKLLLHNVAVTSICKLLKVRGKTVNFDVMDQIMKRYVPLLKHMDPMMMIRVMGMIINPVQGDYSHLVEEFARCIAVKLEGVRIKDLEQICFILYYSNYHKNPSVYQTIGSAVEQCDLSHPHSARSLVYLTSFLSKAGYFKADLADKIMSSANACDKLRLAKSKHELLEASVDWLQTFGPVRRVVEPRGDGKAAYPGLHVEEEMRRRRTMYQNALFHTAELDCNLELDCPGYEGTRLDPELREKLLPLGMHEPPHADTVRTMHKVLADLRHLYGERCALRAKLLPHATTTDIVVCLEKDGQQRMTGIPLEADAAGKLCSDIQRPQVLLPPTYYTSSSTFFVSVLVPKINHLDLDGNPMGPLAHKIRQLSSLSYNVVVLPSFRYNFAESKGTGRSYLRNMISAKISQKQLVEQ